MSVKSERSQRSLSFFTSDDDADFEETFFFWVYVCNERREYYWKQTNTAIQLFSHCISCICLLPGFNHKQII